MNNKYKGTTSNKFSVGDRVVFKCIDNKERFGVITRLDSSVMPYYIRQYGGYLHWWVRESNVQLAQAKREKNVVYVVLEHAIDGCSNSEGKDAVVHGVYNTREAARIKKDRVCNSGYVCILKQRIKGEPNEI